MHTKTPYLKKSFFLLAWLLFPLFCLCQDTDFTYKPNHLDSLETFIANVNIKKITTFDPKQQKKIKELLNERKTAMIADVKDSTFIFDKSIDKSLKKILAEIYKANPEIDHKDFYFLINKSMVPNAACYGNGIFSINLGLFTLIGSDDELASVICHELAHYQLKHTDKSISRYIETFNDKAIKQKLNKAAKQKYGRRAAVNALMKDLDFNFMYRNRKAETEADSLGFKLLSKTKYNKQAFVNLLKKLDVGDEMVFNGTTNLRKHFTFDQYPFKESWLEADANIFETATETENDAKERDSLKTHPDIPFRIQNLEKQFPMNASAGISDVSAQLQKSASANSVKIFFDDSRMDFVLYEILSQYEKGDIDEKTYSSLMAKLLKQTYILKEKHLFGKYVSPVNRFSDEKNINEIRLLLYNLELKNIRKIGHFFCLKYESINKEVDFIDALAFFKNLNPPTKTN